MSSLSIFYTSEALFFFGAVKANDRISKISKDRSTPETALISHPPNESGLLLGWFLFLLLLFIRRTRPEDGNAEERTSKSHVNVAFGIGHTFHLSNRESLIRI